VNYANLNDNWNFGKTFSEKRAENKGLLVHCLYENKKELQNFATL
jgi:hypothetical protein